MGSAKDVHCHAISVCPHAQSKYPDNSQSLTEDNDVSSMTDPRLDKIVLSAVTTLISCGRSDGSIDGPVASRRSLESRCTMIVGMPEASSSSSPTVSWSDGDIGEIATYQLDCLDSRFPYLNDLGLCKEAENCELPDLRIFR